MISINIHIESVRLSLRQMNTFDRITEATNFLKQYNTSGAKVGVVLGSGLGNFVQEIQIEHEIPYEKIPHFPVSTVQGHSGKLIFGIIAGKPIIAMSGRFHFYEGYDAEEVVLPIRVMKFLGVEVVLFSNAACNTSSCVMILLSSRIPMSVITLIANAFIPRWLATITS